MAKTAVSKGLAKSAVLEIRLEPCPDAAQGPILRRQAAGIVITDKTTHETALRNVKDAKQGRRVVEAYYDRPDGPIKRLMTALDAVREMRKSDYAPFDAAIEISSKNAIDFTTEQKRMEQARADAQRREDEAKAAAKREADLAALEASSEDLSDRERVFCDGIVAGFTPANAADRAGYKDPLRKGHDLIAKQKIKDAIANLREAKELAAKPVIVESTSRPESQIAKVAGTHVHTNYYCGSFDAKALLTRLAADYGVDPSVTTAVDRYLLKDTPSADSPVKRMMSNQADSLKELFEQAWPMCKLRKTEGIAG